MYLSKPHIWLDRAIAVFQIVFIGALMFVGAASTISDLLTPGVRTRDIAVSAGIVFASLPFFLRGCAHLRATGTAYRFNHILMGDHDGFISTAKLSASLGIPEPRCREKFDQLVRKGYLINCSLDDRDTPVIALHECNPSVVYLNRSKANVMTAVSILLAGFSEFMLFFCIFSFVGAVGGNYDDIDSMPIWVSVAAIFIPLLVLAFSIRRQVGLAYRYSSMFRYDRDGYLSGERTARILGISNQQLFKEVDKLLRKNYLSGCTLEVQPELRMILNNSACRTAERFDAVTCPNCGASLSLKLGFIGKCPYCDSKIKV